MLWTGKLAGARHAAGDVRSRDRHASRRPSRLAKSNCYSAVAGTVTVAPHVLRPTKRDGAVLSTFDLEVSPTARRAVLRIRGAVRSPDITTAVRSCLALPTRVRSIELDLRMATSLSDDSRQILLALVRAWRQARRGHVAIFASYATLGLLGEPEPGAARSSVSERPDSNRLEALTATYL